MADHYELLGVAPSASAAEIRQAYVRLARERHPDRFSDPEQKQHAGSALQELTTAFNTLVNPRSRAEYDEQRLAPPPRTPEELGRDAFAGAQPLLEAGRLEEAIALLRVAVHHAPTVAAHHAALGRALARVAGCAREAVQALEHAAQLEPASGAIYAELAAVLAAQGLRLRAQRALDTALRLSPHDPRVAQVASELRLS